GDRNRMVQVGGAGGVAIPYPFVFQVQEEELASDSVVTERLKNVMYAEGGSFAAVGKDVALQSLVTTTVDAGFAEARFAGLVGPEQTARSIAVETGKKTIVGVVTGEFKSAFADGPPEGVTDATHLAKAAFKNSIFLIGDVDFMF